MLFAIKKRPQVIRDLIDLATYIAEDSLDVSDSFLIAAETTFKQLIENKVRILNPFVGYHIFLIPVGWVSNNITHH
jgi:hypothetical protein